MSFSSNELNYIVWRYLTESGFEHSAYVFSMESNLLDSDIDCTEVASGALVMMVQRGLFYAEAEFRAMANPDHALLLEEKTDTLGLIEAVMVEPPLSKFRVAQPAPANSDATTTSGMTSPSRNNGTTLGVHGKKQQAAQQASSLTDVATPRTATTDSNGVRHTDALEFPEDKVRFLKCHSSEVFICAWNPVEDLMASGSGDSTARIWNLAGSENPATPSRDFEARTKVLKHCTSGESEKAQQPSNKDVTSLDWDAAGDLLATGCYDGFARIWTAEGRLRCTLGAHKGPIFALKWNAKGDYILSAGVDKSTIVWDAVKGQQVQQFHFHTASALDVDWITNDTFASCSTDKSIHVSRLGCDKPIRTYLGHRNEVNAIKYDQHSNRLASCSDDMSLKIWSLQEDQPVYDWKAHEKEIYTIRWSPLGHMLASASFDHTVRLWDVRRGELVRTLSRHNDPVYSVSFSPDGRYVASGCFDRSVFIWDIQSGKLLQSYVGEKRKGGIFEVSWNARGEKVAASASDGTVILLDVRHIKNRLA
ncbi:hypothetical protein Y032_0446g1600 [Ancylostoma ceylanicum]|uniref:WD domain, G-beta repeat protein n=2 Tax=Ancylostoma ceylanicum TaxID=53326 RepID=A0A016X048_9BILA|nr:hypothetical protein Y032_0446g1600 [Ancylostoma ceylanicum]